MVRPSAGQQAAGIGSKDICVNRRVRRRKSGGVVGKLWLRMFLVLPLARLLGPWFWWPQRIPSLVRAETRPEPALSSHRGDSRD